MALEVEVGLFAKKTTGGNGTTQDVTTGFDPKFIIMWGQLFANNSSAGGSATGSIGFSDGTNHRMLAPRHEDNQISSDCLRGIRETQIIGQVKNSGTAWSSYASISFGTLKFTMTWDLQTTFNMGCNYIVYGGADITGVEVGTFTKSTAGAPVSQSVTVSSADVKSITAGQGILFLMCGDATSVGVFNDDNVSCGMATKTDEEGSIWFGGDDNVTTMENYQAYSEDHILTVRLGNTGALLYECEFTGFDSDGFDVNWTTNNGTAILIYYAILKGGRWQVGNETSKTSTGTKATTTDFEPLGLYMCSVARTATGSAKEDLHVDYGAGDGTDEKSGGFSAQDATASSQIAYYSNIGKVKSFKNQNGSGDATLLAEADLSSFNATDFTLDWTTANASAFKFLWVVCASNAGGTLFERTAAQTITISNVNPRIQGHNRTVSQTITESDIVTQLGVYARTVAQSLTHSESIARILAAIRTASQTITESDSIATQKGVARTASQTITESDSVVRLTGKARTAVQTITESDIVTRIGVFARSISQTLTHVDSVVRENLLSRTASQSLTHSESITSQKGFLRTVTQIITHSESVATLREFFRTISQTLTHSEAIARIIVFLRTASQTITISQIVVAIKSTPGEIIIAGRKLLSSQDSAKILNQSDKTKSLESND